MDEDENVKEKFALLREAIDKHDWKSPPVQKLDPVLASMAMAKMHKSIHEDTKPMCFSNKLPDWAKKLENVTHYATLIILCIFEVELLLLMFSYGFHFLLHPMYVIDFIVITAAIVFEIIIKDSLLALIPAFLRMWRIIRVSQGILLAGKEIHDKETEYLKQKIEELEKEIKEYKKKIDEHEDKIKI